MMTYYHFILITCVLAAAAEPQTVPSATTQLNSTPSVLEDLANINNNNNNNTTTESRVSFITEHLPALKNMVMMICVLTAALITGLVVKVFRSGRRIRKTRKYDIITTPAERVEMSPLNQDNDEEDDSTLFDVKYR